MADSVMNDTWPPANMSMTGMSEPTDWKARHEELRVNAYPVAVSFDEIRIGQWSLIGRKAAGSFDWQYTLYGNDLEQFRTHRDVGQVMTSQVAYPGDPERRDFGLLARRVA